MKIEKQRNANKCPKIAYSSVVKKTSIALLSQGVRAIASIVNKKLSCRREAARCFVFVCSQLQHTYSAVFFYYQLLWLQIY